MLILFSYEVILPEASKQLTILDIISKHLFALKDNFTLVLLCSELSIIVHPGVVAWIYFTCHEYHTKC